MRVVRHIHLMQKASLTLKQRKLSIGFVPTMGALHEGHLSLIRKARSENDAVVVSIFVNPLQFGPAEDFKRYPRPLHQDLSLCRKEKVDIVFHPDPSQMYPQGFKTNVEVFELGDVLCGADRQGHFKGVTTVVAKLFNAVLPDRVYFGQKDCQQAVIIKRMVKDLNFPLEVKVMPIVRQQDGLALSSRNVYLTPEQKREALVLSQALAEARALVTKGLRSASELLKHLQQLISSKRNARIDYVAVVDLDTLRPVEKIRGGCLIALAVRFGRTRLIDNIVIKGLR